MTRPNRENESEKKGAQMITDVRTAELFLRSLFEFDDPIEWIGRLAADDTYTSIILLLCIC